ncbi:MAG: DUF4271 domain-containing protein [Fluviicola sp.]|nr:DUF4271 domain-containing protein [Fluviicola sp.]
MSLQAILFPFLNAVPNELTLRGDSSMKIIGIGLFISFSIIAVTKLIKSDVFVNLGVAFFKQRNLEQYLKDSYSLFEIHSVTQILNYWLSFSLLLYVFFGFPGPGEMQKLALVITIPVLLFAITVGGVLFVAILTGESKVLYSLLYFKILGAQFLGLTFFIIGSIWLLTPINQSTLVLMTVILLSIELIFRLTKSLLRVLDLKVSWYYIILYFCTLEILPMLMGYYLYIREF